MTSAENKQLQPTVLGTEQRQWSAYLILTWATAPLSEASEAIVATSLVGSPETSVTKAYATADLHQPLVKLQVDVTTDPSDAETWLPEEEEAAQGGALSKAIFTSLGALARAGVSTQQVELRDVFLQETVADADGNPSRINPDPDTSIGPGAIFEVFQQQKESILQLRELATSDAAGQANCQPTGLTTCNSPVFSVKYFGSLAQENPTHNPAHAIIQ